MPRYKFAWTNLPQPLLEALARDLNLGNGDPADLLRTEYGARPAEPLVRDAWQTLLGQWLAKDGNARAAVVENLWEVGLGDGDYPARKEGQLTYLAARRNARRLREVVLAELVDAGERPLETRTDSGAASQGLKVDADKAATPARDVVAKRVPQRAVSESHEGHESAEPPRLRDSPQKLAVSKGRPSVDRGEVMGNWGEKVSFIWSVKEILRDHYKRHQYGEIILPLCVIRRLDCVLEPTRDKVLARTKSIRGSIDGHFDLLASLAGQQFYNTSRFSFDNLLDDTDNIAANFLDYLGGFSPNVRDVVAKFDLLPQVERLDSAGILRPVLARFAEIDLHPESLSNLEMGYIYEELIRVTADLSNEEAGEHFTPREVIRLMVNLLLSDEPSLHTPSKIFTVLDPASGTGGMLSEAEARIRQINPSAKVYLYGQEVNPESYAVCRSDMMLKGQDASHIAFGSSLSADGHAGETFDYLLSNPPYGKDWKTEQKFVEKEARLGWAGRFGAGLPPTSDGQLLFVQHMVSKMRKPEDGGSRVAVVLNGSPLFSGDAESGPSEIRRWLIENDWLEAIVGLPDQMFYNTGIYTYIWLITNRKRPERQGHVLLIDARELYAKMRKSLGNKRNELTDEHIATITSLYEECVEGKRTRVVPNDEFGYRKITVERPLRLRWEINDDTLAALTAIKQVIALDDDGRETFVESVRAHNGLSTTDVAEFETNLEASLNKAGFESAAQRKPILTTLAVRDAGAPVVTKHKGVPETDSQLRDTENVPLSEDVEEFVTREVLPYVPDAWIDHDKTKVGYEIPFTRFFYQYVPPRPLAEIDADIKASQRRILQFIAQVAE